MERRGRLDSGVEVEHWGLGTGADAERWNRVRFMDRTAGLNLTSKEILTFRIQGELQVWESLHGIGTVASSQVASGSEMGRRLGLGFRLETGLFQGAEQGQPFFPGFSNGASGGGGNGWGWGSENPRIELKGQPRQHPDPDQPRQRGRCPTPPRLPHAGIGATLCCSEVQRVPGKDRLAKFVGDCAQGLVAEQCLEGVGFRVGGGGVGIHVGVQGWISS